MQQKNNGNSAILLTFLFPFAGLVYSLTHWRESWAKNAFWLACVYLGAVLIYWPEGTILGEGADGGRYVLELMDMYKSNINIIQLFGLYQTDEFHMDLYQPLITFFISRFTDNGHVLFAGFAFVFGFFYSRNMWYILEKLPHKRLGLFSILVALFFLACPITSINGVRMWTALHVFVYGMMPYLLDRDRSKLWWVAITPFIHFSFMYVAIFALIYGYIPYRLKTKSQLFLFVSFVFFVGTLFVNSLSLDAVSDVLNEFSPDSFDRKVELYTNQDYQQAVSASAASFNWYITYSGIIKKWVYNILFILLLPCLKRNFRQDERLFNMYVFTLLLGGLANIMGLIPSGGRFQLLAQIFKISLVLLVMFRVPYTDNFYKILRFTLVLLILPLVVDIRRLFDFFSITSVLGNFITIFFWENNMPLIEWIKYVIR